MENSKSIFDFANDSQINEFIRLNLDANVSKLILKKSLVKLYGKQGLNFICNQIKALQSAKKKLQFFYNEYVENGKNLIFPEKLSIEQSSSEIVAKFKSSLFSGDLALDLCCGFGIDTYFLSKKFNKITSIDINQNLTDINSHNFNILKHSNKVEFINEYVDFYLYKNNTYYDLIYIDPDRRSKNKSKLFKPDDFSPNIKSKLNEIYNQSKTFAFKCSPMTDISSLVDYLEGVSDVYLIESEGELKEILTIRNNKIENNNSKNDYKLKVAILSEEKEQMYELGNNTDKGNSILIDSYENINYLYEPSPAFMKANAWNFLCCEYNLLKISNNTHIFLSSELQMEFPGRILKIQSIFPFSGKIFIEKLKDKKVNIICRNFLMSSKELRDKYKISDGNDSYIYCFKDKFEKPFFAICEKVN